MEDKKGAFESRLGFIMAAIGSAVGLGNIWRFSYIAYENGGGAFLIPYFVVLLTVGIPMLILEIGFGLRQRGSAALSFARLDRKWEWLGWWAPIISFLLMTYYTVIIGWTLNYVGYSFFQSWGNDPETFFFNNHLGLTSGVWEIGNIQINILITVFLVWAANFIIIYKGVQDGVEKASKIFMPLLFILMAIITLRGLTLPGAMAGINKYLTPDFSRLTDSKVWLAAFGQIFFTLSLGFGVMITYASYLPKKSDVVNNAFITGLGNCGFSFMVGMGVFGVLGYMAHQTGVPVDEVITQSIGLAFVAFPKAISMLPAFQTLFSLIFFLALFIAGLSSSISLVEAVVANLMDKFNIERNKAVILVCGIGFLGSVIYTTGAGLYFLDIIDHFNMQFGAALVGVVECLVIAWIFKASRLREWMNPISDFSIGKWWDVLVQYFIPLTLGFSVIKSAIDEFIKPYGGYPISALSMGWIAAVVLIILAVWFAKMNWANERLLNQEVK
ncbi:transporter [Anoxybacter fermentans]|uniref:Transporter n=1 Tax=Anoxybacter fermentans TaxID=1323375 RepID=A0A3Q9HQP6_9FIRM|nr:sodium-dependent transporter [Anoxybacter fermentans]AZR73357.1 transporter [Anoxybacter fermentans]